MGRRKIEDGVREAFEAVDGNSKCSVCAKIISGTHLGNMRNHLVVHHPKTLSQLENDNIKMQEEPAPKKQKITLEYDPNDVANAWLDLVVVEGRPFTILNSPSLRRLVQPIFQALKLRIVSSRNVKEAIDVRAKIIIKDIKDLCAQKMLSIKIDGATRHSRRVVIINIQMIVKNKIVIKTIAVREMPVANHTGLLIKEFVLATLQRYGISLDQVYSTTQDNGSNYILCGKLLKYHEDNEPSDEENEPGDEENESSDDEDSDYDGQDECDDQSEEENNDDNAAENMNGSYDEEDIMNIELNGVQVIRCAAHTLALAVYDTLKSMKPRFRKFRKLSKYLRRPVNIFDIKRCNLKVPKVDMKTRWNSKYDMLLSLQKLKPYCQNKGILHLNTSDWVFCSKFLEIFEPVKIATKYLQKGQLSLGDFFKCWVKLSLKISEFGRTDQLASKLYKNMILREAFLFENNRSIEAALYLDPRFNQVFAKMRPNYFNVARAQQHLLQLYKHLRKIEVKRQEGERTITSPEPSPSTSNAALVPPSSTPLSGTQQNQSPTLANLEDKSSDSELERFMNELFEEHENVNDNVDDEDDAKILRLIRNYSDKQPLETDVIGYWFNKRFACPILYKLACIVHAVPASQVSVERCFSTLKYILSDYRTRMNSDTLEKLMLIMLNSGKF